MTAAGTLRAMTGSPLNTTNCHLYHYAGNNPVKYVDPDGRISYSSVKRADPEKMDRDSARKWIRDEVVNDSRYPVCQILYELGLNGFEGIYEF
ncbi:MAG: hypothetical protein IJL80_06590, partial [Treponema sp.]|nr:hypothetical protein [Treponema sp.]